jgi:hypothetical protein
MVNVQESWLPITETWKCLFLLFLDTQVSLVSKERTHDHLFRLSRLFRLFPLSHHHHHHTNPFSQV